MGNAWLTPYPTSTRLRQLPFDFPLFSFTRTLKALPSLSNGLISISLNSPAAEPNSSSRPFRKCHVSGSRENTSDKYDGTESPSGSKFILDES